MQPSPTDQWRPLSPRVVTLVKRAHGENVTLGPLDSLGRRIGAIFYFVLYDPLDGRFLGTTLDEFVPAAKRRPPEQCIQLRSDTHPDDFDWGILRVDPATGEVRPAPVQLLPAGVPE
jgi:hypothetical protein